MLLFLLFALWRLGAATLVAAVVAGQMLVLDQYGLIGYPRLR